MKILKSLKSELSNLYRGKRFEYDTCLMIRNNLDLNHNQPLQSFSDEAILKSPLSVRLKVKRENGWLRHVEIRCPDSQLWIEDTFIMVFGDLIKEYMNCINLAEKSEKVGEMALYNPIYIEYFEINELNVSGNG